MLLFLLARLAKQLLLLLLAGHLEEDFDPTLLTPTHSCYHPLTAALQLSDSAVCRSVSGGSENKTVMAVNRTIAVTEAVYTAVSPHAVDWLVLV